MVFQLVSLLMEPQNRDVGKKLLVYTIAMFSLPVVVFYAFRSLFKPEDTRRDMWGGFAAVAAVNVIIAVYVVSAFKEDKEEEEGNKRGPTPAVGVWAMQREKERTD